MPDLAAFSPDAARRSAGAAVADVERSARTAAAERFAGAEVPKAAEEMWRYSRIEQLDLERYAPAALETSVQGPVDRLAPVGRDADPIADRFDAPDLFADLNAAFPSPVVLRVPPGTTISEPIVVEHRTSGAGSAVFPRLVLDVGEDAEVTVVERFGSPDGDDALIVPVLHVRADRAARVRYLAVNELGDSTWQIGHQQAVGERDSSVTLATVALGGHYARVRTEASVAGVGASTRQVALYFAGGRQMHDFRTIQDHAAAHGNSDLLFKGAVQDEARSVYTGLIRIRHEARGTNAFQTNRTLTLSEGSWAESVPNLEIETNDVRCSHASTVGPIDEDQRFYLESRGIPVPVAERLIVLGFFDEVLEQLPAPHLHGDLRRRVAAKLTSDTGAEEVAA